MTHFFDDLNPETKGQILAFWYCHVVTHLAGIPLL
jgi:hypothetical protein